MDRIIFEATAVEMTTNGEKARVFRDSWGLKPGDDGRIKVTCSIWPVPTLEAKRLASRAGWIRDPFGDYRITSRFIQFLFQKNLVHFITLGDKDDEDEAEIVPLEPPWAIVEQVARWLRNQTVEDLMELGYDEIAAQAMAALMPGKAVRETRRKAD